MTDPKDPSHTTRPSLKSGLVALAFGVGVALAIGNAADDIVVGLIVGGMLAAGLGRYLAGQDVEQG